MIDDILKIMLATPELNLSPEANKELLFRTNDLGDDLSLENFHKHVDDKQKNGPCCFRRSEWKQIQAFLTHWDTFQLRFKKFLDQLHFVWHIVHGKRVSGDDILPFFICMLPDEKEQLVKLNDAFYLITNIYQHYYFGTVLHAAIKFKLKQNDGANDEDEKLFTKSQQVLAFIKNPDDYMLMRITLRLANTLLKKSQEKIADSENNAIKQNLRLAYLELNQFIFNSDESLAGRINRLIKICKDSEDLMADFAKTPIPITRSMNQYLQIPPPHHYSLFGFRPLHYPEISVSTLFAQLTKKLNPEAAILTLQ